MKRKSKLLKLTKFMSFLFSLIFIVVILATCGKDNKNDNTLEQLEKSIKTKDSLQSGVVKNKVPENKIKIDNNHIDTLFKKSLPFKINGINCFWELSLFLHKGEKGGTGKLELRNQKNSKIILSDEDGDGDYYSLDELGNWHSFNRMNFELMNANVIKDANFDGYKDFVLYHRGASGSAGEFSYIYLFNPTKKIFERSKALSGYNIVIDSTSKTVSSYARNGGSYNVSETIHFGRNGKIKYSEVTERETIDYNSPLFKITYRKIINDKVVKTKIDSVTNY